MESPKPNLMLKYTFMGSFKNQMIHETWVNMSVASFKRKFVTKTSSNDLNLYKFVIMMSKLIFIYILNVQYTMYCTVHQQSICAS